VSRTAFRGDLLLGEEWRLRDFRGLRVAVVASADEAAGIVPYVAGSASSVKVFQRSPALLLPARVPVPGGPIRRALARLNLRLSVDDPWLRRQLTPYGDRPRVVVRRGFYAALQQPNCKLYTWPVYAIVEQGLRSAEGVEHRVDVIILGADVDIASCATREEHIA
jgi:cation diffusion facilitator CzcD-associated flavoprotein CzcO